jgi:transposase
LGIDVHKKMLAVVVSDVEIEDEYQFERRLFGSSPEQLRSLAAWLLGQEAEEVVMESTAQYWKPVWEALERYWKPIRQKREGARPTSGTLHLAQAQSNRGRRGRKRDFLDAERLVKRLVARELTLRFVPDAEQRLWRTVTRRKYQLTRDHVRLQNQWESLLEEAHIKLSSLVSDLLGVRARRMLKALADGETNPTALAALADGRLRATPVVRRARRVHSAQPRLPEAVADGLAGAAIDRRADRSTRPRDGESAPPASGRGRAVGRGAGSGSAFGTADHCRSACHGRDFSFDQATLLVGGCLPRRRRERGCELQPPVSPRATGTCGAF